LRTVIEARDKAGLALVSMPFSPATAPAANPFSAFGSGASQMRSPSSTTFCQPGADRPGSIWMPSPENVWISVFLTVRSRTGPATIPCASVRPLVALSA
jgi:hypothetical protein